MSLKTLDLLIKEISDVNVQENFRRLGQFFSQYLFKNFVLVEQEISEVATNVKIGHNLGIVPKDVILTQATNDAIITFKHDLFTSNILVLSSDKVCKIRVLVGKF